MNKVNQNKSKREEKHKFSAACFNKCVEWKLNASIFLNKTSFGYVFKYIIQLFTGKSLFFRNLESSILNTLQNSFSLPEANKKLFRKFDEKSNAQLNEGNNDKMNDILNIKFPIDNSEFNFMIIDANLGISDNLNNIFFLEFDLTNTTSNKDQLKFLREINQECVDKEIFFILNVNIFCNLIYRGLFMVYRCLKARLNSLWRQENS